MAVRHAFQSELYGLTPAQRTTGAAAVNNALDGENFSEVSNRTVDPNRIGHGSEALLFVEVDFTTTAAGVRVFDTAAAWASTRATDAASGLHSYVRVRSITEGGGITQRLSESPGWVTEVTTEDSRR